jgi:hypothetical protein
MILEHQFASLCTWDCCNSVLRDLWKLFMKFFLFNSCFEHLFNSCFELVQAQDVQNMSWNFFSCFEHLELALVRPAYCVDLGFLHETGLLIRVPSYRVHRGCSSSIILIRELSFACHASHFTSMSSSVLLHNLRAP